MGFDCCLKVLPGKMIERSTKFTMLDHEGDTSPNFYLEIVEFPTRDKPGKGIHCGANHQFTFMFKPNWETGLLDGWACERNIKFSMKLITVGGSVVGFEVTFSDNPHFVAHYAYNITEDIVYDIFAPPVYIEEFS